MSSSSSRTDFLVMADQPRLKLIEDHPIGNGLDAFRASSRGPDDITQLDRAKTQNLTLGLLLALRNLPVAGLLPSKSAGRTLEDDILKLISAVASDDFDLDRFQTLLGAALADKPKDALIWNLVSAATLESTPPPRLIVSSIQETPWHRNTSSLVNSSEFRHDIDRLLKEELGPIYVDLPNFCEAFFGGVPAVKAVSEAVFRKCTEGVSPLFGSNGWREWPASANEQYVLAWFKHLIPKLEAFVEEHDISTCRRRKLLAQPKTPLPGSTGRRSMDIGFVNDEFTYGPRSATNSRYRWSHILVPGELKSNPAADILSIAWIDLATYAREVLSAQDNRRFVLGFTLCGSLMRVWKFDRLGGVASKRFNINEDGLQFVSAICGFLYLSEEALGFDPTIMTLGSERYIEIERNGQKERLIIDEVMRRARCIAGRATTCWKAHYEKDPRTPLVIKDSWQYEERDEEGELLQEATDKGVINVARYYHHETVRVGGVDDDVLNKIRRGLKASKATNYGPMLTSSTNAISTTPRQGRSLSAAGVKRQSSETGVALPPSKRSCSASPKINSLPSRVHRRVILRDYGKPIYKASSRAALLAAFQGCIEGHESLRKAGIIHRDISINNMMINEQDDNPSWSSFLIDLDLGIKEARIKASGAQGKTGTRAFMAIGALIGEPHSFMHDLESFFWVLLWICIHYHGPEQCRVVPEFDQWNYANTGVLARMKLGLVATEAMFIWTITNNLTPYYEPLIPLLNRLRKVVFPRNGPWEREDETLYSQMRELLAGEV